VAGGRAALAPGDPDDGVATTLPAGRDVHLSALVGAGLAAARDQPGRGVTLLARPAGPFVKQAMAGVPYEANLRVRVFGGCLLAG
jgi:hypothetical protein